MSYILDALRKAEAERQRGQLPGLGSAPSAASVLAAAEPGRNLMWAAVAGLGLLAAGAAAWWVLRGAPAPTAAPAPASAVAAVPATQAAAPTPLPTPPPAPLPTPAPLPQVVSAPSPAAVASANRSAAAAAVAQALGMPQQPAAAAPVRPATATPAPSRTQAPAAVPTPVLAPVPAQAAKPAAAEAPHAVKLADLSPDQRRDFPALSVGGSVWSDSPASRFVIINGLVLREGESLAPGLVLERLQPKAAWLRWRGMLVELPF